jgi:hypothetical protein
MRLRRLDSIRFGLIRSGSIRLDFQKAARGGGTGRGATHPSASDPAAALIRPL